jgi:hypothetical protein
MDLLEAAKLVGFLENSYNRDWFCLESYPIPHPIRGHRGKISSRPGGI